MGADSTAAKKSKRFKWLIRLAIAVVIYTVVGFFILPAVIKSQMLKRLPALTKRQPSIEQVKCNPYVLSLTIRGFALKEPGGEVFASFDEFYANFQLWASLFKWGFVFDEISLKKPFGQIVYQPDGTFNFANLLTNAPSAPKPKSAQPQSLPSVIISHLIVTNGVVAFADLNRKEPFRTQFAPIDLNLTTLTTIRDKNSPYKFTARTGEGETFGWSGTVTINPLRSSGTFRIGGLPLKKYSTYSHDYAKFEIVSGILDIGADYRYDSATNALDLTVSNAAVHLTSLELKAPDTGETVVKIPQLSVMQTEASVARMSARVGLVKSSGGEILVRQNQDSTINLLAMLNSTAKTAKENKAPVTQAFPPLTAKIDEIAFDNYTIKAEDKKPAKPAAFTMDQLAFNLKGVSNASNAPVAVTASLRFQDTGFIGVNGTATLLPPSADLQVALTNIDLRTAQSYVEEQIKLAITSGALNAHGRARYASPESNAPLISFAGDVAITNFDTADDVLFKDFAKWQALNVDGIELAMQPDKLRIGQIKFTGLNTSLIVGPDHRANLQTILRNQIATKTNTAAVSPTAETPPATATRKILDIAVNALVFENASIHFADQSLEPHCTFDVQEFGGSIKGLSSQEGTTAIVDVKGKVDDRSPFSVSGKVNPLGSDIYADVSVAFTNTELTAFTPYTEKFAGRPLQKGKLSYTVHCYLDKKSLKAENYFYVDQLTLGPKNDSTNATKLPVKLGIALLKDRHGRIELPVPVKGRIDDPEFSYAPIVWHVIENLLVKAAASPFSLLGAMFGGGEELSYVSFEPGLANIPDAETNKLNTLIKALFERPELTMEINGSADPATDRGPLAKLKLQDQIKALWVKEQTTAGKSAVAIADVQLQQADYERLLRQLYKTNFGAYQPTDSPTNQFSPEELRASAARAEAARQLALVAEESRHEHGATLLTGSLKPAKIPSAKPPPVAPKPAVLPQPAEPMLADMELQLLQKIEVTDDDLRDLMKARAAKVQAYLLQGEKIAPDRLFITAPKPMGLSSKGEDRVNLTLD